MSAPSEPATLRIVSGTPDPAELAALATVLAARAGAEPADPAEPAGGWSDLSLRLHRSPPAGPGAWRNSGRW
ncbi:MAG: acyl-CoA carboxylase epsilon subunit [Jatrophihabitans sp.]